MSSPKLKNRVRDKVLEEKNTLAEEKGRTVYLYEIFNNIQDNTDLGVENVAHIYKGYSNGSLYTALKLAEYFDCRVEDLYEAD